jgi:AraC-like DNA-binding protein
MFSGVNSGTDLAVASSSTGHQHAHPFYEVLMAVKGTSLYGTDRTIFLCRPGTMVLIPPNRPHASKYLPSDNHLFHIWVSFITPEQAFAQFIIVERGRFRRLHDERCLINVDAPGRLLHKLNSNDSAGSPAKSGQARLLLHAFFSELIRLVIESGYHPPGMIDRELMPQKKIDLVCAGLREAAGLNTTLAATAAAAGYSPSHFARLFKRVTGHTFHEHIDARRLERVKKLLNDNTPQKTISDMLGFTSKSTFSRWLSKYRRSLQL